MIVGVFGDNSPPDAFTDQEIRALIGETAIAFYKGLHDARMVTLHKKLVFWECLPETGVLGVPARNKTGIDASPNTERGARPACVGRMPKPSKNSRDDGPAPRHRSRPARDPARGPGGSRPA